MWGSVATLGAAVVLAILTRADPAEWVRRAGRRILAVPTRRYTLAIGALGTIASGVVALAVFHALPTSVDEMVQLLHARTLLAGHASLVLPADPAAWMIQNSLLVDGGWASVYPPMHTFLLAAGLAVGAPWLVGPLATGVLAGASAASFERLLPNARLTARLAGALVALSPFVVFLGATELSHPTAGAFVALTLLFALRARDGSWGWSVAAGAAGGAAVCDRPWTGLALCAAVLAATWLPLAARGATDSAKRVGARLGGLLLGGTPFAAFLLAWNERLYGGPFRLGYIAAFGPAHRLGFHADPWGNVYGAREALAYTGADLMQLGVRLFESPLPATGLIGLALLVLPKLPRATGVLFAWACAGVAANAVYWHHGIHFGPRLLFETAPAWIALWAIAAGRLTTVGSPLPPRLRRTLGWAAALSLVGGIVLLPGIVAAYGGGADARLPTPPDPPALLFVHGSWDSRLSARLASMGMRRDSIETALRRNDVCAVERYTAWRKQSRGDAPTLDFEALPGTPTHLQARTLSPGNRVLVDPRATPLAVCVRQGESDREGTVELEPLLWQAPPLAGASVVVARDLGPEENRAVRAAYPKYRSWALVDGGPGGPRIADYETTMSTLWGAGGSVPSEPGR